MRRNRIKGVVAINPRRKNVCDTQPKPDGSTIIIYDSENGEIKKLKETQINGLEGDTRDPVIESSCSSRNQCNKTSDSTTCSTPNSDIKTTEIPCSNEHLLFQRNILKIPESINVLSKWSEEDLKDEETSQEKIENKNHGEDEASENHSDVENLSQTNANQNTFRSTLATESGFTLDETILSPLNNAVIEPEETNEKEKHSRKPIQLMSNVVHSDTEYPPPPSPNKVNRLRIKAIPRFGYRKTSFSASESEDESRKHNRNRNDSVCSSTSIIADSVAECLSPQRPKEVAVSTVPKKFNRSEQTRKLAEARREFQRRFGANVPDRKKLTMMDLIFYNPMSNRIVKEEKSNEENAITDKTPNDHVEEGETIDDPEMQEDSADKSDEENAIPVPQIKIGPSGEIILDEKSLVIERKEVKRQREEMQKTKILDGDFDTGYGIYKKHKRSKSWTHEETIRFYKALNIIGTDFTMMCELFPKRSRRELKMKFKKEERINRALVNRAVMNPCTFELDELKNEVAMEEKEMEELKKIKEESKKRKAEDSKMKQERLAEKAKKRKSALTGSLKIIKALKPEPVASKVSKKRKKVKLDIDAYVEESDADESDLGTQSESDDEIVIPQGPTRSGRMPKVTKKYENELCTVENLMLKNKVPSNMKPADVEPGSIMIITEVGPNGEPVYKIFMVTPDHTATPLNISSDRVTEAIQLKKGMSAQNILTISANITDDEVEAPIENNQTIPADETVKPRLLKAECDALTSGDETVQVNKGVISEYESDASIPANETRTSPQNFVVMNHEN